MKELNELTVNQAVNGLKEKKFSAFDITRACLARIKQVQPKINAFITVCEKEALARAKDIDHQIKQSKDLVSFFKKQPLSGIPVGIKDNFCTRGIRTTAASNILADYVPAYDATVVERLKKAGAIILGKTNMDAWAHGSSTETSDFGTTKNPWDLTRLPGGSSGGSAAAVVSGQVIASIGSETAGSIRQPAAWCGVVGFKPTYGRVSRYGLIAMASSTDSPGSMTTTVSDAALILKVLAGNDGKDATASPKKVGNFTKALKENLKRIKIGVPEQYFFKGMSEEVIKVVKREIKKFKNIGVELVGVSLLDPKLAVATYTVAQRSEVSSNLARFDGIRYGFNRDKFGGEAKRRIMLGTYTLSSGYFDQYYIKAQKTRTMIIRDFERVFKKVDLLVSPTTPSPALKVGASLNEPLFGELQDILVEASSLAGLPGVSLPCGMTDSGLPVGLQIIGPQFSEEKLFSLANGYQQISDWHLKKPTF